MLDKEKLADLCHSQWSGWMRYLFSKCVDEYVDTDNGKLRCRNMTIIPRHLVDRWTRQMNTDYKDLSEEEKNSDRKEAAKFVRAALNEDLEDNTFRGEFFDTQLEKTSYVDGWFSGTHLGCKVMLDHIAEQLKLSSEQKEKFESEIEDITSAIDTR